MERDIWSGDFKMPRVERGSCFCGKIEIDAVGEPFWISWDHDDDCRKAIGSPLTIWIGYRSDQVLYVNGAPKSYSKTPGIVRSFCGDCGTSISYEDQGLPSEVYISIGFMNDPARFEPEAHGYWEQRLPFVQMSDSLPREARYTRHRVAGFKFPRDR
jgi:hypothetical protein